MIWRLLKVSLTAMILLWLATKAFQLQSVETQKRLEQEQTVGPGQSEEEVVAPLETELPAEVQRKRRAARRREMGVCISMSLGKAEKTASKVPN